MFLVVVSALIDMIEPCLLNTTGVFKVKKKDARLFIYVASPEERYKIVFRLKKIIRANAGKIISFDIYGFYKGKIDLFSYLPDDVKDKNEYYQLDPDLSEEEIENFFKEHPELEH